MEPLKYQWVDSITVNGLTVQLIGVNTISCKEQTENSDWSVFGTFEEDWGTHQTERTSSGKGLILFHMTETNFKVMMVIKNQELPGQMIHCGWRACASEHNTPAGIYWNHRNKWLASN